MIKESRKKFAGKREKSEFDQKLLDLARVTRVVKGGRRFSFRATIVIGNRRGKVGVGVAKGSDVSDAISKATADAKKSLVTVKRSNTTIAYEVREKYGAAKVLIKPAKEGKGIVAGGAMRTVIELAGIKDISAKSLGSANKINVARATAKALASLQAMKNVKKADASQPAQEEAETAVTAAPKAESEVKAEIKS